MDLSEEQHETLLNFQAITENWDQNLAVQILNRNAWVLHDAINEYMVYTGNLNQVHVSTASRGQTQSFYDDEILEAPPRVVRSNTVTSRPASNNSFLSKIKNTFGSVIAVPVPLHSIAADKFKDRLTRITDGECPVVSTLMLPEVIASAKSRKKMLAMYVHPSEVPWTYILEVFSHDLTIEILNSHFIFWAVEKDSPDGEIITNLLKPELFPCLAVVNTEHPQPIILEKLEGTHSTEKVISFLSRNYTTRPVIDHNQKRLIEERKLRSRQERELKEAEKILIDRQKEQQRAKEELEKKEKEERNRLEMVEKEKQLKIEKVGPEPDENDSCLVIFRMPDGKKVERRFGKERNLQVLYDFLEVLGWFGCEILFGFPSKVICELDEILETSALYPKALVIVRPKEE
jgi:FAS-associated factor 2